MPEMKTLTVDGTTFDIVDDSAVHCTYYTNLSTAITDLNNGVTTNAVSDASTAKVSVGKADNGMTTVTLLDNLTESVLIEVNKDINLVLNGYTLNFNAIGALLHFGDGTDCVISGEIAGSAITMIVPTAATAVQQIVRTAGKKLTVRGGSYSISGNSKLTLGFNHRVGMLVLENINVSLTTSSNVSGSIAYAIQCAKETANSHIKNSTITSRGAVQNNAIMLLGDNSSIVESCNISAVTLPDESVTKGNAKGIHLNARARLTITDSTVFSDGPGDDASETMTTGITNYGTIFCKNTNATGTQCGIMNGGALYVSGGTFTGYSHGGFYLSDCTTEGLEGVAYINDAVIQNGNYTGEFTDIFAGDTVTLMGGIYIGSGSNITAYLDGCTINENNPSYWGMVLRGSSNETNNVVNISNSTVGGMIRVDNETLILNVGANTNIQDDKIREDPSFVRYTNEVYRRHHPDEILNGNDYATLVDIIEDAIEDIPECVATDDGNGVISFSPTSGGGSVISQVEQKYELLETITVGDTDLGTVVRDGFELDAVALVVKCPVTETTGKLQPRFHYVKSTGGTNYWTMLNHTVTNASNKWEIHIEFYKRFGFWRYDYLSQVPYWSGSYQAQPQNNFIMNDTEIRYVNKITLMTTTLPSGTTISIYGVRRNG